MAAQKSKEPEASSELAPLIRFRVKRGTRGRSAGQYRVVIVARNGKQIFWSGETYLKRSTANAAINSLIGAILGADFSIER